MSGHRFTLLVFDLFQDLSDIHSYDPQSSTLSIQVNSFSTCTIRITIWNEMPLSLRKLSKNVVKMKIKQRLFKIPASEDCYIDLPETIYKVKLKFFPLS